MARLHEFQGKAILKQHGIPIPAGSVAESPARAEEIAREIGGPVVVKMQAWTTHRAAMGGIAFADAPQQASTAAEQMIGKQVGAFTVDKVLVEQKLDIRDEYFASVTIDDAARKPVLLFSAAGGSGIEQRAQSTGGVIQHRIDVASGLADYTARNLVRKAGLTGTVQRDVAAAMVKLVDAFTRSDARSAEINPLVVTSDGKVLAADCRITIDDYAVYRHPELGIAIARELDHPPTRLERIAQKVEDDDFRGTFYFAQLATGFDRDDGYIGFHGAGGGGSMMSMDAITDAGFKLANFTDTSGNPSAAKVYRAAVIICHQPNIVGYFGSGSGVASQEQFHSAYGLAKAFYEMGLNVPAVIRLGGNSEDRAVRILNDACRDLPAPVEGFKKDDAPAFCANRFGELVRAHKPANQPMAWRKPKPAAGCYSFPIRGGRVYIDYARCDDAVNQILLEFGQGIFAIEDGKPILAIDEKEVAGKDSELIACEVECRTRATDAIYVDLPIEGLTAESVAGRTD